MRQFTVGRLMALVLASGLVFVALTRPTPLGNRLAFSAALLAALVATIGARVACGSTRARCVGFSTLAGAYLILSLGPWCDEHVAPHLATTTLIDRTYSSLRIGPEIAMLGGGPIFRSVKPSDQVVEGQMSEALRLLREANRLLQISYQGIPAGPQTVAPPGRSRKDYRRLGHSLLALLLGQIGAVIGGRFLQGPDDAAPDVSIDPRPGSHPSSDPTLPA